jgi:hypothetical protein
MSGFIFDEIGIVLFSSGLSFDFDGELITTDLINFFLLNHLFILIRNRMQILASFLKILRLNKSSYGKNKVFKTESELNRLSPILLLTWQSLQENNR